MVEKADIALPHKAIVTAVYPSKAHRWHQISKRDFEWKVGRGGFRKSENGI